MISVDLDGVSSLALIKAEANVNLDGISSLALIRVREDLTAVSKINFLNHISVQYNLNYIFNDLNVGFWNISPIYLKDPTNPKRSVIRLSALDGNGSYSGYRDLVYNRMDIADYMSTLGELTHSTTRYRGFSQLSTIKNLLALEFSEDEVEILEETIGDITKFTITIVDDNSLLWYGTGSISVSDIPDISTVIPLNTVIMSE